MFTWFYLKIFHFYANVMNKKYVWYASYGSNLRKNRFLCYIIGGQPNGSTKQYSGAHDKSLPIADKPITIPHQLYFAKKSPSWNDGGVAFINTASAKISKTLGRMYLITQDQFCDVVSQETNSDSTAIDFARALQANSIIIKESSWYGNLIYLGSHESFPIFTFTNEQNLSPFVNPDINYIKTIIEGLKETYSLDKESVLKYLLTAHGLGYTKEQLDRII